MPKPVLRTCLTLGTFAVLLPSPAFGQAPPGYEIRDTTAWDNSDAFGLHYHDGHYGTLYYRGAFVDTVEIRFGLLPFDGGVIYRPVGTELADRYPGADPDTTRAWVGKPETYFKDGQRTLLRELLPQYSGNAAVVADGRVLYYWGVRPDTAQWWTRLSAMRYDARTAQVDSTLLHVDYFDTDSGGFFRPVKKVGALLCFYESWGNRLFLLDSAMTIVRRFGPPSRVVGRSNDWQSRENRSCDDVRP